jgi:hypothetical protein
MPHLCKPPVRLKMYQSPQLEHCWVDRLSCSISHCSVCVGYTMKPPARTDCWALLSWSRYSCSDVNPVRISNHASLMHRCYQQTIGSHSCYTPLRLLRYASSCRMDLNPSSIFNKQ